MKLSPNDLRIILLTRLALMLTIAAALAVGCVPETKRPAEPTAVTIGRAYSAVCTSSYSAAWSSAAAEVEAGKPIAETIARIRPASDAARVRAFEATVSPIFEAIVPAGTPDKDVLPERRAALARAFREFAQGLGP